MLTTAPPVLPAYSLSEDRLAPNAPDPINIDAVIRFIGRNWRLCLKWLFVSLCVGVAFVTLAPGYYTAYTTILLKDRAPGPSAEPAVGAAAVDPTYADSQIEVLQSDEVVRRVVDRNRLTEVEEFGQTGGGVLSLISRFVSAEEFGQTGSGVLSFISRFVSPGEQGSAAAPTLEHATLVRVKHALSVRRQGMSDAVEIGFTSKDPTRAATIANSVAQSYIDNQIDLAREAFEDATSHLRESLAEIRDKAFAIAPARDSSLPTPETGEEALARSRELQNNAGAYQALYNNLLQRRYAESIGQFSVPAARVISPADPPVERSWPRSILVFAVAVAVGLAGGVGHALLRQATDHTYWTVEDVRRSTGFERVVAIPKMKGRAWKAGRSRQRALQPVYVRASSKFTGAIGKVAVRLQGGLRHRKGLIIGVAAPTRAAGASSVAAHLARAIAESGQKTLLVDANWQDRSIDQALLEPNSGRKLANKLAIINLDAERLFVLLLRPTAPISDLNASLSIVAALEQVQADYACVVVDFHSAEQTADFEANLAAVNEAIVVVEARRTSTESLNDFLRLIPGAKLAALVLNKA